MCAYFERAGFFALVTILIFMCAYGPAYRANAAAREGRVTGKAAIITPEAGIASGDMEETGPVSPDSETAPSESGESESWFKSVFYREFWTIAVFFVISAGAVAISVPWK